MRSIHPVFAFVEDSHGTATPIEFRGTCFELAEGAVLTAAHVVAPPIDDSQWLGVAMLDSDRLETHAVTRVVHGPSGVDLARLEIPGLASESPMRLAEDPIETGEDVLTFSYPLTREERLHLSTRSFTLHPRYLQGYVTGHFRYEEVPGAGTGAIELDMKVPPGASGAPLIRVGTTEVVGVLFGRTSTTLGDETYTWGLAHALDTVRTLLM